MSKRLGHILLVMFLTFAVTDYLWIYLFQQNQTLVELETEGEAAFEGEFRDARSHSDNIHIADIGPLLKADPFFIPNITNGFVRCGNSFRLLIRRNSPKLFVLFCRFRFHSAN